MIREELKPFTTIYHITGKTKGEVESLARSFIERYPPEGYMTTIDCGPEALSSGQWYCRVTRANSCD